jgi:hypothetical protein
MCLTKFLLAGSDGNALSRCPPHFSPVLGLHTEAVVEWRRLLHSVLREVKENSPIGEYSSGLNV